MRPLSRWCALGALLAMAACRTTRPAAVRYSVDAEVEAVRSAALDVAGELGWEVEKTNAGHFRLLETAGAFDGEPLVVSVRAGADGGALLSLTGQAEASGKAALSLSPAADVFAQAVRQTAAPHQLSEAAVAVAPRSSGVAVLLDLLSPPLGAAYALQDDPYWLAPRDWRSQVLWRAAEEAVGWLLVAASFHPLNPERIVTGDSPPPATLMAALGVLIHNRIRSAVFDRSATAARNRLAQLEVRLEPGPPPPAAPASAPRD